MRSCSKKRSARLIAFSFLVLCTAGSTTVSGQHDSDEIALSRVPSWRIGEHRDASSLLDGVIPVELVCRHLITRFMEFNPLEGRNYLRDDFDADEMMNDAEKEECRELWKARRKSEVAALEIEVAKSRRELGRVLAQLNRAYQTLLESHSAWSEAREASWGREVTWNRYNSLVLVFEAAVKARESFLAELPGARQALENLESAHAGLQMARQPTSPPKNREEMIARALSLNLDLVPEEGLRFDLGADSVILKRYNEPTNWVIEIEFPIENHALGALPFVRYPNKDAPVQILVRVPHEALKILAFPVSKEKCDCTAEGERCSNEASIKAPGGWSICSASVWKRSDNNGEWSQSEASRKAVSIKCSADKGDWGARGWIKTTATASFIADDASQEQLDTYCTPLWKGKTSGGSQTGYCQCLGEPREHGYEVVSAFAACSEAECRNLCFIVARSRRFDYRGTATCPD